MARAIVLIVGFCLLLVSCTQRLVCPAYQSAYIYDKEALRKKFSYFKEDSTPKIYSASKNKYLIAEPVSYKKKVRSLQTVPMKRVNVTVPDSLKEGAEITKAELDSAANSIIDSTYIVDKPVADSAQLAEDSVYVISKDREVRVLKYNSFDRKYYVDTIGFNTQQDNYMWYLRDVLLLPDAKLARQGTEEGGSKGEGGKSKKEKKGFFKNLFKKKKKSDVEQDSTLNEKPVEEENYYDDFEGKAKDSTTVDSPTRTQNQQQPAAKQKKGMFSFMKKKDKPAKKKKENTDPAKKEDDKDDGF